MDNNSALLFIMRSLFFFLAKSSLDRESSFELQVKMVAGLLFCVVMTGRRRSGMGTRRGMQPFAVASMGRGESKALQFALLVDPF